MPVPRPGPGETVPAGALRDVLLRSRELGFLGPGEIEVHVRNADAFLTALPGRRPAGPAVEAAQLLDLGSGGGVPGLALAAERDDLRVVLLDAAQRRTEFLEWAVGELGIADRASVVRGRAEELAHEPDLRGRFDVVTARSFGPPAVTAECAVGFLAGPGSVLLVSEPPGGDPDRWPAGPLAEIGLRPGATWEGVGATVRALEVVAGCPDRLPRRVGLPARRPLF
ncbi:RsmG family class I SAM-dependent methyltransferase [Dermatobacter hominis]|uniref:RsmG family class I SAM-dependent methyltransferase n=1 Tax=Dermatobacter hominis TaxID=2884263 RepID=UPI001D0FC5A6|nr:RsmG family class I SAM-dependent methyltransferase [Dermatobacter hominis]UDY34350.1 class I SAM-dependent methyltransferase [Dermatobacter hominis]